MERSSIQQIKESTLTIIKTIEDNFRNGIEMTFFFIFLDPNDCRDYL